MASFAASRFPASPNSTGGMHCITRALGFKLMAVAVADGKGGASVDKGPGNGVGGSSVGFAGEIRLLFLRFSWGFLVLWVGLNGKDWFLMVSYCWIGLRRGGLVILVESLLGSFALGLQEITKWAIAFERRVRRWF